MLPAKSANCKVSDASARPILIAHLHNLGQNKGMQRRVRWLMHRRQIYG